MSDDSKRFVSVEMATEKVEAIDALADAYGSSRSDLLRRSADLLLETQADALERQGELIEQEAQHVEENQKRRNIVRFPSTVRDLFIEDIKADVKIDKLRRLANEYREQARMKEELARELDPEDPIVDPGELVEDVDHELRHAVQAADLSNWYDQHENPYAAELGGVRDGIEEREDLVALVAGLVDTHGSLCRAFSDPQNAPGIEASDLPPMASTLLPDDVSKQDVADFATELARRGLTGEQVREQFAGATWDPDAIDVDATVEDDEDAPEATIRMGGQPTSLDPATGDEEPNDDETPVAVPASDDTQADISRAIATADGGRTPAARRSGWNQPEEEDTDMTPTESDHDDSTDYDDPSEASERLRMLTEAASAGGEADE